MATILIVEDVPIIREPIAVALRKAGYDVRSAADGRQALAVLKGLVPDLLLLDIHMPGMDGLELLRRMRVDPALRDVPVILLTDDAERDTVVAARGYGVSQYLLKSSFSMDSLFERIGAITAGAAPGNSDVSRKPDGVTPPTAAQPPDSRAHLGAGAGTGAPEGDESHDISSLKPLMSRSELLERLEASGEPKAMSPTVSEVLRLSRSSTASTEQLARAIRRDHAIALKILRLANSSAYAAGEPVDSVEKAVLRIGMHAIDQAVLNISVVEQFSDFGDGLRLDPRLFWEHSIAVGVIAARIAKATGCTQPDTAFTMGLLHDVGRAIYAEKLGEDYQSVMRIASELRAPLECVESRLLLLNHADGMDRFLHAWKLPRDLTDPIVFHHLSLGDIRKMTPKRLPEVATLALADRLAHALLLGSSGNETIYPTHDFCRALGLNAEAVSDLERAVPDEANALKLSMLTAAGNQDWPDARAGVLERLGGAFRPRFIGASPGIDAFRIFCEQLGDRAEAPPSCAVMHLTDVRDRVPLSNELRRVESEAKCVALPLLVLSPSGNLKPEEGLMAARRHALLSTPVTVDAFVDAVETLRSDLSAAA